MKQVVAVVGPTASGKTSLGIALAEALDTEIISADSMQFYKGMEIGTGAPSPEELSRVRHHFIGHLRPNEEMTASDFQQEARQVVVSLNQQGKIAVVVGGSGLYIQALIDGLFEGPGKDQDLRDRLIEEADEQGMETLYERLERVDPEYAARINENDLRRIVRALEVYKITGTPFTVLQESHKEDADTLDALQVAIDYPREELYVRINRRVDGMLEAGLVAEIEGLVDQGFEEDIYRLKSLGYREVLSAVKGVELLDEAVDNMKMYTRRYAKRQLTWFKGDMRVQWLPTTQFETDTFRLKHILKVLDQE